MPVGMLLDFASPGLCCWVLPEGRYNRYRLSVLCVVTEDARLRLARPLLFVTTEGDGIIDIVSAGVVL